MSDEAIQDRALWFDPFAGDDSDYRTLKNRIIRTRAAHQCANCADEIPAGVADVRTMTQTFEGQIMTWWWCPLCTQAMRDEDAFYNESGEDDGEDEQLPPFERRARPALVRP